MYTTFCRWKKRRSEIEKEKHQLNDIWEPVFYEFAANNDSNKWNEQHYFYSAPHQWFGFERFVQVQIFFCGFHAKYSIQIDEHCSCPFIFFWCKLSEKYFNLCKRCDTFSKMQMQQRCVISRKKNSGIFCLAVFRDRCEFKITKFTPH